MKGRRLGRWARRTLVLGTALTVASGVAVGVNALASTPSHLPFGHVDRVVQIPGGFQTGGWAIDPDTSASIYVHVYMDGKFQTYVLANGYRPDIAAKYPSSGGNHGFLVNVLAPAGTHTVCVYAINSGAGTGNPAIGCRTLTLNYSPSGAITSLIQYGSGFHVTGWARDPDTSAAVTVKVYADGNQVATGLANQTAATQSGYSYRVNGSIGTAAGPGTHQICVTAVNLGTYGSDTQIGCQSIFLNFNPSIGVVSLVQKSPGVHIVGWAQDPDTSSPVSVRLLADGTTFATVTANGTGYGHDGHVFSAQSPALPNGTHTICAIAVNLMYGNGNTTTCQNPTLNFNPFGHFDAAGRSGNTLTVGGWAMDPDTTGTIPIQVTVDGVAQSPAGTTGGYRPDVAKIYPGTGSNQGFNLSYPLNDNEHNVCVTAVNVLGGNGNTSLGCKIVNALHPTVPSAPQNVTAVGGYGGAIVSWTAPASDGGAPWSKFVVTASPGGASVTAGATDRTATVTGLSPSTTYTFTVVAVNVVGNSPAGTSAAVTTQAAPPPQTTPAPISTSRYIRNLASATSTDLATMNAEGRADATANPSGHGYLILLDIGGQDQADGGVLLTAGTHFVSYADLVKDLNSYVDGYHAAQRASAPVTIALGTNNDVDVSASSGATWAASVVNQVRAHAQSYPGITIAGADDMEPGFSASYAQTQSWLSGYLGATSAPFVFNGSADGCAWTLANSGCNNGWTMSGLYWLSAGAAPTRIINLPQIYNNTMAAQWKYISLTGIGQSKPRINFGGPLTEWTACTQSPCSSLTGNEAWTQLWNQLRSDSRTSIGSLPYSTDLRIDK